MGDVEFAFARRAPDPLGQRGGVVLRECAAHDRIGGRVLAQGHDFAAQRRVLDHVAPRRRLPDGVGIAGVAECPPRLPQGRKPGLLDELKKAARRRALHRQVGIEVGFDLGSRQQIVEARPGRLGGLADRAGNCPARLA